MLTRRAQEQQPLSLSGLNDIELPPEPPHWPPAPEWWALAVSLLLSGTVLAVQLLRRHRALAYRRAALAELAQLRAEGDISELPALLKRVALAAYPRGEVASLSGGPWLEFLSRTGGFDAAAGRQLLQLAYGGASGLDEPGSTRAAPAGEDALVEAAASWIRAQGPCPAEASA